MVAAAPKIYNLLLILLALTGAGLLIFARTSMNVVVTSAVLVHIGVGVALAIPVLVASVWRLKAGPRSAEPLSMQAALAVVTVSGLLMVGAAWAHNAVMPGSSAFMAHISAGALVIVLGGLRCLRAVVRRRRPVKASVGALALVLMVAGASALCGSAYRVDEYYLRLTSTNALQAHNSLFPAGTVLAQDVTATVGPDSRCGSSGCHSREYIQNAQSGHARAGVSCARGMQSIAAANGPGAQRWCVGCHAPLSLRETARASAAATGVGCTTCHLMQAPADITGNGRAVYYAQAIYPWAQSTGGTYRLLHDFLIRVRLMPHITGLNPASRGVNMGSDSCAPCHGQSIGAVQNRYGFVSYDSTYSSWRGSIYSGRSLHTFALPGLTAQNSQRSCVSCHMVGTMGHVCPSRMAPSGADRSVSGYALPYSHPLRITIMGLRRRTNLVGGPETLIAPLAVHRVSLSPGESGSLDIVVENRGIGHAFPDGVPDMRQAWIQVTIRDARGRVRLVSGGPTRSGAPGPEAHRYGLVGILANGQPATPGEAWRIVAAAMRQAIPAGESDVARFGFTCPAGTGGALRVEARLLYRRRSGDPEVTMATDSELLSVKEAGYLQSPASGRRDDPAEAPLFYAYGVGLLRRQDSTRALAAFRQARNLMPQDPENYVAIARTYLELGDLLSAQRSLQQALLLDPQSDRVRAWLGRTWRQMGRYQEAVDLLGPVSQRHPNDPDLYFDIGRSVLQMGDYPEAILNFRQMLALNPDDESAHLNLMQAYRMARQLSNARTEETIYSTLRTDARPDLMARFGNLHPEIVRESEPIHQHQLSAVSP